MKTVGFQTFLFVRGKPRGIKPEEIKDSPPTVKIELKNDKLIEEILNKITQKD